MRVDTSYLPCLQVSVLKREASSKDLKCNFYIPSSGKWHPVVTLWGTIPEKLCHEIWAVLHLQNKSTHHTKHMIAETKAVPPQFTFSYISVQTKDRSQEKPPAKELHFSWHPFRSNLMQSVHKIQCSEFCCCVFWWGIADQWNRNWDGEKGDNMTTWAEFHGHFLSKGNQREAQLSFIFK